MSNKLTCCSCVSRSELTDLGRAGQIVRSLNAPFQICPGITTPEEATSLAAKLSFRSTDLGSLLIERYGQHLFLRHRSCRRIHPLEPSSSFQPSPNEVQCTACAAFVEHPNDYGEGEDVSGMEAEEGNNQHCADAAENEEEEATEKGEQKEEAAGVTEDFGKLGF
jgi:hypothetical protein